MYKLLWGVRLALAIILGAVCTGADRVNGAEFEAPINRLPPTLAVQVPIALTPATRVSELTDIALSDWAFQALQRLVKTYDCQQNILASSLWEQKNLTRLEFAVMLDHCGQAIAANALKISNSEDLATLARLKQEFQTELSALNTSITNLDTDITELQAQPFSITTKLRGQVDVHLGVPLDPTDVLDDDNEPEIVEKNASMVARARLNFDTSFMGDDRLRLRLQSRNGNFLDPLGGLADGGNGNSSVGLTDLYYSFPLGDRLDITVSARGLQGNDWVTSTIVPYDGPAVANAAAPRFYDSGGSSSRGSGLGVSLELTDDLVFDVGYTTANSRRIPSASGIRFTPASHSYIAQLSYRGDGILDTGLVYMHNNRSVEFAGGQEGTTDTYAALMSLYFGDFFVAGHGAYQVFKGGTDVSWTVGLGIEDFLVDGSQLGLYGGQLPQLKDYAHNPFLIELYFEIPIRPFLTITPALIYGEANLRNDGGTRTDDTSLYGVIRATFKF